MLEFDSVCSTRCIHVFQWLSLTATPQLKLARAFRGRGRGRVTHTFNTYWSNYYMHIEVIIIIYMWIVLRTEKKRKVILMYKLNEKEKRVNTSTLLA